MMERHKDMISGLSIQLLEMRAGAVIKLRLAAEACLTSQQGSLWITRSNDSRDYWLMPGAGLSFPHAGLVLLEAYGDSALTIESRRPARSVMRWLSKVLHALAKLRYRWNSRRCTPHPL